MKKSTAIIIIGIFLFLIGSGLLAFGFIARGGTPEEYDDWVTDEKRKPGDEITITGKIEEKFGGEFGGLGFYRYRFEGSDQPFFSSDGDPKEGDTITVTIEIDDSGMPVAKSSFSTEICLIPGVIMFIISIILFIYAFRIRRKEKRETIFVQPGPYPIPQPQQKLPPIEQYQDKQPYNQDRRNDRYNRERR
jgi:hypothetical protein